MYNLNINRPSQKHNVAKNNANATLIGIIEIHIFIYYPTSTSLPPKRDFQQIFLISPPVGKIGMRGMSTKVQKQFIFLSIKFPISNYRSETTVYYLMDNNNG